MKKSKISFLFLCLLLLNLLANGSQFLFAQSIEDSTAFYRRAIDEINDVSILPKAFDFFERKSQEALKINDSIRAVFYLELIALGQFEMGFYYESEATAIDALTILNRLDSLSVVEPQKRLNNHLGMLYRKIKDYDNASLFYKRAFALNNKVLDGIMITSNMANLDADQGYYLEAVNKLMPYYNDALTLDHLSSKASYLDNLGFYQSKLGMPDGIKNMEASLAIRKELKDLIGLFSSHRHLTIYYSDINNRPLALSYAQITRSISDSIKRPSYQAEARKLILKLVNNQDFNKFIAFIDTLESEKLAKENKFAAIKYNIIESERKLQESQLQTERQKQYTLVYLFSGIFILLTFVFSFIYLRSKHKKDKLQVVYNTESSISKRLHDELANDMYQVMSKLETDNVKEDVLDKLEDIYSKTRDISKSISQLEDNNNFLDQLKDLLLSYNGPEISVVSKGMENIVWAKVPRLKKITIYRVLQELLTNMKKHSNATNALVSFKMKGDAVNIEYKDNGVGCELSKKGGLANAENRIKTMRGTIIFESLPNKGFYAKILV